MCPDYYLVTSMMARNHGPSTGSGATVGGGGSERPTCPPETSSGYSRKFIRLLQFVILLAFLNALSRRFQLAFGMPDWGSRVASSDMPWSTHGLTIFKSLQWDGSLQTKALHIHRRRLLVEHSVRFHLRGRQLENSAAQPAGTNETMLPPTNATIAPTTTVPSSSATDQILPVVVVALAVTILLCAILMYITDMTDRCRHDKMVQEHIAKSTASIMAAAAAASAGNSSSRVTSEMWQGSSLEQLQQTNVEDDAFMRVDPMLPPMRAEPDVDHVFIPQLAATDGVADCPSISRMSTMTASWCDLGEIEERSIGHQYQVAEEEIVELDQVDRVCAKLETIVKTPERAPVKSFLIHDSDDEDEAFQAPKTCSISPLSGPGESTHSDDDTENEEVIDIGVSPPSSPELLQGTVPCRKTAEHRPSINASFDASAGMSDEKREPAESEQQTANSGTDVRIGIDDFSPFVTTIPRLALPSNSTDNWSSNVYVRDIYFVPNATTKVNLGFSVAPTMSLTSCPVVCACLKDGPLADSISKGDAILLVNDQSTTGWSPERVYQSLKESPKFGELTRMIKVTIMSTRSNTIANGNSGDECQVDDIRDAPAILERPALFEI